MSKEVEKAKKCLRMMNNSIDSDMYANESIETILKYIEELEKENKRLKTNYQRVSLSRDSFSKQIS